MKKFKIIILSYIIICLSACGSVKEGFSNKNKNNNDEFLVEKKSPLIMPPDYNELPLPKGGIIQNNEEKKEIKSLIETTNENTNSNNSETINKTFEETLLEKIKNN